MFFAIKRYALHDGPNLRTTVFFKGCPLRCFWCHNPEGIHDGLEVVTVQDKCIGCGECLQGCPESALSWQSGTIRRATERCSLCLNCVEICPSLAHEAVGYHCSIEAMVAEIEKDLAFYDLSGGGVTFSGGEPLHQATYLIRLLQRCGELEIHRSVDTSGYAKTSVVLETAQHTDLFLYDLKHMDPVQHKKHTGVDNELILANLKKLNEIGASVRIRLPLLKKINDSAEHLESMGRFLAGLEHINDVDLLVYHDLAGAKYKKLSRADLNSRTYAPDMESISRATEILEGFGLRVHQER